MLLEVFRIVTAVKKFAHFTDHLTDVVLGDCHLLYALDFGEAATRLLQGVNPVA